ncbi:hypothetical protein TNCV_3963961, partial [Trichonephila clavipes]
NACVTDFLLDDLHPTSTKEYGSMILGYHQRSEVFSFPKTLSRVWGHCRAPEIRKLTIDLVERRKTHE